MTTIHAKDAQGREVSLPVTNSATIRKGEKFTIAGSSVIYRAIAPQMSDAEYALIGWARDMVRRFARTGKRG